MSDLVNTSRRFFLRGAGALLALPYLESLAFGRNVSEPPPTRFCFLYVPNGMSMDGWRPPGVGPLAGSSLPPILRPLANHLDYCCVATGLDNKIADTQKGDPAGQHARSAAGFLSAVHPTQPHKDDFRAGTTIDVVLAGHMQQHSRVPLLNLGTEYSEKTREENYSEVFNYSLSWKDGRTPIQPIISPRYAFELLCGNAKTPDEMEARFEERQYYKKSILDGVIDASASLRGRLNPSDQQSLDDYLESIRAVEQGINRSAAEQPAACVSDPLYLDDQQSYETHLTSMLDLLVLAFRARITAVATFMFGSELTYRDYGFLGSRVGFDMAGTYHSISHHKNDPNLLRKYVAINTYHTQHLARFVKKLRETKEADGNLLDHTFIVYGSAMADGNTHEHRDLPILLAGRGNSLMNPGKQGMHINYGGKPVSNLYLTLLQKMLIADAKGDVYSSFGDSGGTIDLPGGQ